MITPEDREDQAELDQITRRTVANYKAAAARRRSGIEQFGEAYVGSIDGCWNGSVGSPSNFTAEVIPSR